VAESNDGQMTVFKGLICSFARLYYGHYSDTV